MNLNRHRLHRYALFLAFVLLLCLNLALPLSGLLADSWTSLDDSVEGTGPQQFAYSGSGWQHCADCGDWLFNKTRSWSASAGDTVTLKFSGTQLTFYGGMNPHGGRAIAIIDGGPETLISFYSPVEQGNQALWTSPRLPSGDHQFVLRVSGDKIAASLGFEVIVDRVAIQTGTPATISPASTRSNKLSTATPCPSSASQDVAPTFVPSGSTGYSGTLTPDVRTGRASTSGNPSQPVPCSTKTLIQIVPLDTGPAPTFLPCGTLSTATPDCWTKTAIAQVPSNTPSPTPTATQTLPPRPPAPVYATSHYVTTTDPGLLNQQGCDEATDEQQRGNLHALIILDFGDPKRSNGQYGAATMLKQGPRTPTFVTINDITQGVKDYLKGYWRCSSQTMKLTLAVGTTSGVSHQDSIFMLDNTQIEAHGKAWADMIIALDQYVTFHPRDDLGTTSYKSRFTVAGGMDIENWASPDKVRAWVDAFELETRSYPSIVYYDFGTCDGCDLSAPSSNISRYYNSANCAMLSGSNWCMDYWWYVSWGVRNAYPVPEIYNQDTNAYGWHNLSRFGVICGNTDANPGCWLPVILRKERSFSRVLRHSGTGV